MCLALGSPGMEPDVMLIVMTSADDLGKLLLKTTLGDYPTRVSQLTSLFKTGRKRKRATTVS